MGSPQEWLQLPVSSLVTAPWNYKKKTGEEVEEAKLKVRAALRKRGQIVNLIVREMPEGLYEVVNGNHRLEVFLEDAVEKAMCFNLGVVSQEQAEMIALETNELNVPADPYALGKLLDHVISTVPIVEAVETLPFTLAEIKDLTADAKLIDLNERLGDEDKIPETPKTPLVKMGDLFVLGNHRLLCGDSTKADQVVRLMNGEMADMVFTDPPYGVDYEGVNNDHLKAEKLRGFITDALRAIDSSLKAGGCFYVWHPDIHAYEFIGAVRDTGWQQARPAVLQWVKDSLVLSQGDYHSRNEPCLYGWKPGAGHKRVEDRTQDTIWECPKPKRSDEHPTMKPVELCQRAVINSSEPGWIVADSFLGSGSTLIACEKTGRKCYGMEIDPFYCQVILTRWAEFTGEDPVREDGVTWHDLITNP